MRAGQADTVDLRRRRLLIAGLTAAGGFAIGVPVLRSRAAEDAPAGGRIGFFVEIRPDNTVLIGVAQPEIGQGVRTALPMLVAEELEVDWSAVSIEQMPLGIVKTTGGFTWKYGGQGVGGSTTVIENWEYLRQVGATARQMLVEAASRRWSVPVEQCLARSGHVHCDGHEPFSYAELATDAAALPVPDAAPALKPASEFRVIGQPTSVVDGHDIVTGQARYGIDTEVPGMRFAVIWRSPQLDARVASFDDAAARRVPGVLDVFTIEGPQEGAPYLILASGVAVVADSLWAALKGREALNVQWTPSPHAEESTASFWAQAEHLLDGQGQLVRKDGDLDAALASAKHTVTARYREPFVSHAPLEPQNCFAHVREDSAHIIAPTQIPCGALRAVAEITGLSPDRITVDMTRVGGGFGRRLSNDYVAEATMVSKHTGWPIQLVWTREDDMRHDFYRPSGLHELRAGVGANGQVSAWSHRLASASKYYRRPKVPPEEMWKPELHADDFPAGLVDNLELEWLAVSSGVPRGSWRAPAHTANAFVVQSFLDEVAHASGQDPLELRLRMYGDSRELPYGDHGGPTFNPGRLARLLRHVAKTIDYGAKRPRGQGLGIAAHFTFGGYAAHAVEVRVGKKGELDIQRIVAAVDCGVMVNPRGVEAQLQGGTIDGLSTALNLEITIRDGQVEQGNFDSYRLLRLAQVPPAVECHLLPWGDKPTGMGEIGIPSVAPALTNAIFNACGLRIRNLPIGDQLREHFS